MGLTKAELLAVKVKSETVYIPELRGSVIVRGMTGIERDEWEMSCIRFNGRNREFNGRNLRARLVVRCTFNEDGTRMFADEDAAQLGKIGAHVLQRLYDAVTRVSGVSDEDFQELEKHSAEGDTSGSPTS